MLRPKTFFPRLSMKGPQMGLYTREKMAKNREKDDSPSSLPPSSWPPRPRLSRQLPPLTTGKTITLVLAIVLSVVYLAFKYTAAGGSLAKHCRCESNSMSTYIKAAIIYQIIALSCWPTCCKNLHSSRKRCSSAHHYSARCACRLVSGLANRCKRPAMA